MYRALFTTLLLWFAPLANAQTDRSARVAIVAFGNGPDAAGEQLALALDSAVRATGIPAPVTLVRSDTMIRKLVAHTYGYGGNDSLAAADRRALARFMRIDALIEIEVPDTARLAASISVLCLRTSNQRPAIQRAASRSRRELIQELVPLLLSIIADLGRELAVPVPAAGFC